MLDVSKIMNYLKVKHPNVFSSLMNKTTITQIPSR